MEKGKGSRVRVIRKCTGLTAEKFAEKLNVSRSCIAAVENELQPLSERLAKDICREYDINYLWLTTGEGEMVSNIKTTLIDEIVKEYSLNKDEEEALYAFLNANGKERKSMVDFMIYVGFKKGA